MLQIPSKIRGSNSKMLQRPLKRQLPAPTCYKFHQNVAKSKMKGSNYKILQRQLKWHLPAPRCCKQQENGQKSRNAGPHGIPWFDQTKKNQDLGMLISHRNVLYQYQFIYLYIYISVFDPSTCHGNGQHTWLVIFQFSAADPLIGIPNDVGMTMHLPCLDRSTQVTLCSGVGKGVEDPT